MTHLAFRARREEIDQMRDGMESVSRISFLQISEACWKVVFPASSDVQINAEAFLDRVSNASLAGLSSRESETMEWLRKYVSRVGHLILRALDIRASNPQNALTRISFHSPKSLPPPPRHSNHFSHLLF